MFLLRLILLTLLGDSIKVWGRMQFINPPPFGNGDTSQNVVYAAGSTVNLRWTEGTPDKATSMTMFQLNATQFMPDFEYITQSVVNITSFTWIVATSKNLTFSNMFYMCIFEEGATTSDSNSHYFNISSKGATNSESGTISSSTSSTKTSETTSVTIGTTLLPVSITTSTSSTPQSSATSINVSDDGDNNDSEHDGLGLGAKIGLGVGIPVAVAFGIGIGWLILGRRRKQNASTDVPAPMYEARPPVNSQYRGVPFHHQRGHSELDPEHEETFKPTEYYSNAHHPSYELPSEYPVRNMPQEMQGHEAIYQRR